MSGNAATSNYAVRPLQDGDAPGILAVLNAAFGKQLSPQWFEWKHRAGPWGPSVGWVGVGPNGRIAAVRLMTPWSLWSDHGSITIERAMDGAVDPSAQRQGLFSRCVVAEMDAIRSGDRSAALIYSTSVPASREAYRKLGWSISDVPHMLRLTPPGARSFAKVVWDDALAQEIPVGKPLETAWTADALRWRISKLSGNTYRTVRLGHSDQTHGLIVRRTQLKHVPALVVVFAWGPERDLRALIGATAARMRTPLVLSAGATPGLHGGRRVNASTVSVWSPEMDRGQRDAKTLPLQFADLEGAM